MCVSSNPPPGSAMYPLNAVPAVLPDHQHVALIAARRGSSRPLRRCCALSGWGRRSGAEGMERRRPMAASARGLPQAGRLDDVEKV